MKKEKNAGQQAIIAQHFRLFFFNILDFVRMMWRESEKNREEEKSQKL